MNGKTPPREARGKRTSGGAASGPAAARARAANSAAVRRALRGESVSHEPLLAFARSNYLFMLAGVAAAVIGFVLLGMGDISLAPILLVVGYCVLIPIGIVRRPRAAKIQGGGE
jgi:hypothetical protein